MNKKITIRLALIALTGAWIVPVLPAADATATVVSASHTSPPITAVRAKDQVGADVFSTDNVKVGVLSDYVMEFGTLPQLRFVVVKSGGFLSLHADQRAIPADAITLADSRLQVNITGEAFGQLPVLPINHRSFLTSAESLANMAKLCGTPAEHANLNGDYVLFSDLGVMSNVVDKNGEDLGYFSDLWVDFNANESPYLEFDPATGALDSFGNIDYLVPTTAIKNVKAGQIHLAVSAGEFEHLKSLDNIPAYLAAAGEKLESAQP